MFKRIINFEQRDPIGAAVILCCVGMGLQVVGLVVSLIGK